ncbi:MAG: GNAT family N-acetyltransferase [Tepidisphaeraceae bacterium]
MDGDLALVAPEARWGDEVLRACAHPLTVRDAPAEAAMTRQKLHDFLKTAPAGRQEGDPAAGRVPAYHFWMRLDPPVGDPPIGMAGGMAFRIGASAEIELYSGNIGYHVYPPARGRRLAERACRLIFPLARRHGMDRLWITCNPDNVASRRTCERLGAKLVEVLPIPMDHPFRARGETEKCRFLMELI